MTLIDEFRTIEDLLVLKNNKHKHDIHKIVFGKPIEGSICLGS